MALKSNANPCHLNGLLPVRPLFPVFNFASISICLHTVPPFVFWSSYQSTSLGIIIKYLTYFSFTIHSINMASPIRLTWTQVLVKEWKGNCYHHHQNKTFQLKITVSTTNRLRWSRGSVLAFGTQVHRFKPGRSRLIFKGK